MPYVRKLLRYRIETRVSELADVLNSQSGEDKRALSGLLNFAITTLVLTLFGGKPTCYADIAIVTGVLENVKQELYRRWAAPFEDRKASENGDVFP